MTENNMNENNKKHYLIIHGHFYQPPRENPWLEAIELQDSAKPFHDWNARIAYECYTPNSVSRIVNHNNQVLDIVNNYEMINFNFGPTLLSWLEINARKNYRKILEADKISAEKHSGYGNALAQVYNHMIMPLANEKDKYTQVIWGIRDFQFRFGRYPEGMWLSETAVDHETLKVLIDCNIKFTVLSPFQSEKIRKIDAEDDNNWKIVNRGNVDPGRSYRYSLKDGTDRYIDLLFSDVIMPEMSGYELASIVSEEDPNIKIQLTSGFHDEGDSQFDNEVLRLNLLSKPYHTNILLKKVRLLLDKL